MYRNRGLTCTGCRSQHERNDKPVPCDEGECPYLFSPGGEGALHPDNEEAVWLWKRLKVVGPMALDLVTLRLSELEASHLLEKLYELDLAHAELRDRYPEVKLLWDPQ